MEAPAGTTFASTTTLVGMQLPSTAISAPTVTATMTDFMKILEKPENGECQLLGPFSLLVQAALGGLALLSLVYKRYRERPQRPLKIWAFDVSKQVFGSVMLHLANLILSMFSAGHFEIRQEYQPNPCSFYLLNLGIDVSFISICFCSLLNLLSFLGSVTDRMLSFRLDNVGYPYSVPFSSSHISPCSVHALSTTT